VSPFSPAAYLLPVGLLVVFTWLLARAVARGDSFGCACFGASDEAIGPGTVARTAALLALAVLALVAVLTGRPDELAPGRQFSVSAAVVLVLAALSLLTAIHATRPFAD
jgi:hypothetical protein